MRAIDLANDIEFIFKTSAITPYWTGNLKFSSIMSLSTGEKTAQVIIGGDIAPYAVFLEYGEYVARSNKANKHKGFVEKIFQSEVYPYLEQLEIK